MMGIYGKFCDRHVFRQIKKRPTVAFKLAPAALRLFLTHVPISRHCRAHPFARWGARFALVRTGLDRAAYAGVARPLLEGRTGAAGQSAIGADGEAGAFRCRAART